jgi:hypothetical protein
LIFPVQTQQVRRLLCGGDVGFAAGAFAVKIDWLPRRLPALFREQVPALR